MPVDRRQLMLGAAAVVVLVLAAWTLWPSTPAPARGAGADAARGRAAERGAAADRPGRSAPVKLDALTASRDEPGEAARNPFRFQPKVVAAAAAADGRRRR